MSNINDSKEPKPLREREKEDFKRTQESQIFEEIDFKEIDL